MKKVLLVLVFVLSLIFQINAQWVQLSGGEIISLAVKNSIVYAGSYWGGILKSTNNFTTWDYANNGLTEMRIEELAILDSTAFAGTPNRLFTSNINTSTWIINEIAGYKWSQALDVNNSQIFYGYNLNGKAYLFFSNDHGTHWSPMNNSKFNGLRPTSFAFGSNLLYAGFSNGGMFLSTDGGSSWYCYSNGLPPNGAIRCLLLHNQLLFAGTGYWGMFITSDNGSNWFPINNGIANLDIKGISEYGTNLFISTWGGGVFMTTNNGDSWTNINQGLTNFYVSDIVNNGTYLFIGTKGDGVWRRSISEIITEVNDPNPIIERFVLEQNYPNPFNPSTKISWQSPIGGWQILKIYDVLGNEVATLVNEYRSAGSYEVEFNPASINHHPSSGVYFYRLQAGDYVETKKMILLK